MSNTISWQPIDTVPNYLPVDVLYRNATFNPPVEGVLRGARLSNAFWRDMSQRGVPACFVIGWRPEATVEA